MEATAPTPRITFGSFELDPESGELLKNGRRIRLQDQPFQVLLALLEKPGRVVTREEFQQRLWSKDTFVDFEHGLNAAINRLRQVLDDSAEMPRYIETLPRRGYRFIYPVASSVPEPFRPPASPSRSWIARACSLITKSRALFHKIDFRRLPIAAITMVAVAVVIVGLYLLTANKGISPYAVRETPIDSLAILPLTNGSDDENAEYLADGITESIINSLSQLSKLRVVARTTVFRYKNRVTDPLNVGKELGVRAVLTGRVTRRGDVLIIQADLMDIADGTQLWGNQYNRKVFDILSVQEEIAKQISEKLRLKLTGEEQKLLAKHYTENAEAYQLYLKGRYFWNKRTEEGIKKSLEYFQQATDRDASFALAYTGIADSYNYLGYSLIGERPTREVLPKGKQSALKALELDDTLAEAHGSLAITLFLYDWRWPEAEREFKLALELDPKYASGHHWYSHYLMAMGRFEESLIESKKALDLDPLDLPINNHLGWHHLFSRQYDQAIQQFQKALDLNSGFPPAYLYLGESYEQKRMYKEALTQFQEAIRLTGGSAVMKAALGHAYALSGRQEEAEKVLDELNYLSKQKYVSPADIAKIYTALIRKNEAFQWLEKAYEERSSTLVYLKVDPAFDDLRSDSRFSDLLRRVGLLP